MFLALAVYESGHVNKGRVVFHYFSHLLCVKGSLFRTKKTPRSCVMQMNSTSTASRRVLLFHNPVSTVSLLQIVVCQFAHGRMESGLRKTKKHQ